ncbi:hypothetical protein Bpfe_021960 [Biomphalaria pfeifferi]|uniref:Uncharacterized protein n=1 Tax=Biomphalaria pfeifferi TaxID=112525 RepID=A0AAD8F2C0_BIOPF|nr:hypothetical protein Bpfe_021960 [Biomphalaria pfeifferi]
MLQAKPQEYSVYSKALKKNFASHKSIMPLISFVGCGILGGAAVIGYSLKTKADIRTHDKKQVEYANILPESCFKLFHQTPLEDDPRLVEARKLVYGQTSN